MVTEPPADARWQALLVGVASNVHGDDPGFVQSLNSQAEFARALERNMPGLGDDDLNVLPEPRYPQEVTVAIASLNEAHDNDGRAGLVRPGLLFYYCGHGMDADGQLYLSMVETIDKDLSRRRTGLALSAVLDAKRHRPHALHRRTGGVDARGRSRCGSVDRPGDGIPVAGDATGQALRGGPAALSAAGRRERCDRARPERRVLRIVLEDTMGGHPQSRLKGKGRSIRGYSRGRSHPFRAGTRPCRQLEFLKLSAKRQLPTVIEGYRTSYSGTMAT
jgi:hypothetical protein